MRITETYKSVAALAGIPLAEVGTHAQTWLGPGVIAQMRLTNEAPEMSWSIYEDAADGAIFQGVARVDAEAEEVVFRDEDVHTNFLEFCEAVQLLSVKQG
ncbi:hypothetical protein [Cupriavidus nantongensis]|uniref:Uncharacterized protein n=1 Tax=Cupriavidus nantongensis TaxID=1796606 RepID=A0A142JKL4_9BURK|nr:hypothetical protein [Cupriavidus nantongensis]AMR78626.1 hypothetical protein A2G96_13220 [Cupriavidus nantongensis]